VQTSLLSHPVFGIVVFLMIALLIAVTNAVSLTRLGRYPQIPPGFPKESLPFLSVLVPVRNEETNIAACINSLLNQDYPNYEVLVLDDYSTDHTRQILDELAALNNQLHVLESQPLPQGWVGKNWACHQLSLAAQGTLILFVDADTTHSPSMLSQSISALLAEKVDMLTGLPRQLVMTWGERLIVPIMYFSLMAFLPLPLAYRLRSPVFSAANGQFMLFRRAAYDKIGGYAAINFHGTDDLALVRLAKINNLTWRMADGTKHANTRMYRNFHQAFDGFSKNLFAAFDYRILPFLFVWLWVGYLFFRPPVELIIRLLINQRDPGVTLLCLVSVLEALCLWGLALLRLRFPPWLFLLYPAIVIMGVFVALRSMLLSLRGQTTWKGRTLDRPMIRWI
jgi:chlorobactene glucosyltransferase